MRSKKHTRGWVIGLIVGSVVAFTFPLLIIFPVSGLQTTSTELSTSTSPSETTTTSPVLTTTSPVLTTTSPVLTTTSSELTTTQPENKANTWTAETGDPPFPFDSYPKSVNIGYSNLSGNPEQITEVRLKITSTGPVQVTIDGDTMQYATLGVEKNYLSTPLMTNTLSITLQPTTANPFTVETIFFF